MMALSNKNAVVALSAAAVGLSTLVLWRATRKKKKEAGNKKLPPVGPSLGQYFKCRAEGTLFDQQFVWTAQYGSTFTMPSHVPGVFSDWVAIADPLLTRELCVTQANQYRDPSRFATRTERFAQAVQDGVGRSLTSTTGEEWKWRRAAFLKEMHKSKLMNQDRQLIEFLFETGQRVLCDKFAQAAASGEVIQVDAVTTEAALDTIMYFMFGRVPSATCSATEVCLAAKNTLGYVLATLNPSFSHVAKYIPGTSANETFRKRNAACRIIDRIFLDELKLLIQESSGKRPRCPDRKPGSMLEQWLSSEPKFSERSLRHIVAECRGLIVAGFDTTAHTLSHCFGMMAEHKKLSQQLHEISTQVLAEHGNDRRAALEASGFVKYFFLESARLYPLVPQLNGVATDDIAVKDSKGTEYMFPKGTNFMFMNGALQRVPEHCGKPSQGAGPNEVDPTRWMTSPQEEPFLHLFNTGAHTCAGKPLALLEGHIFLLLVASQFDFDFPEGVSKVQYEENLLLRPKDAMPLHVRRRARKQ